MKVKDISLAWVTTADFEKSKDFWTNVVGLKVDNFVEQYQWMELKGEQGARLGVGASNPQEPIKPGQNAVVAFTVENLDQCIAEMKPKGAKFLGDVIEIPGHVKMISFTDPDGNRFQLAERLDDK